LLKIESGASMQRARNMLRDVLRTAAESKEHKKLIINVDVDAW
jgi:hypothetical protein